MAADREWESPRIDTIFDPIHSNLLNASDNHLLLAYGQGYATENIHFALYRIGLNGSELRACDEPQSPL